MIARSQIRNLIDKVESNYIRCWETLSGMKDPSLKKLDVEALLDFQPILARSLFELNEMYRSLHQERKSVIARKESLSTKWFENRLRLIRDYQHGIKNAIAIGKVLGDSFAWFFYHKQRKYLRKHLRQQRQFHTPPGIGGIGELEYIDRFKVVNGHLVIYHGITSFLRVGDVSFINLDTLRVTAIGELKTRRVDSKEIEINLTALGPDKEEISTLALAPTTADQETSTGKSPLIDKFPQSAKDRFNRQLRRMVESFEAPQPDAELSLDINAPVDELEALFEELKVSQARYRQVGDGLIIMGFLDGRRSLYSQLMKDWNFNLDEKFDELIYYAQEIIHPESKYNIYLIDNFHIPSSEYQLSPSSVPFFWWPLNLEFIRQVVFREILLFSIYNPAHFIEKLKLSDFTVEYVHEEHFFRVIKTLDDRTFVLNRLKHFFRLIALQLFPEEAVIRIIENTIEDIQANNVPDNARVEIQTFEHILW